MSAEARGKVVFIAGDESLRTARAEELLEAADVIFRGEATPSQLVALTSRGKTVARVSPRFVESEIVAMAERGIPFELVPGVGLESALGAFAGISLENYLFVRDTEPLEWTSVAHAAETLVFETSALDDVVTKLLEHARSPDTPALAIVDLGRPTQRIAEGILSDVATRARRMPGGERLLVVGHRGRIMKWFDARPLFGKRVLVPRAEDQAKKTIALLRERGAEAVSVPAIVLRPLPHDLGDIARYDYVAFTSANAVSFVFAELSRRGRDARAFGGVRICAIGAATARALEERGLRADLLAKESRGEGLAADLLQAADAPKRLLLPRARVAREALPDALRAAGWTVDVVPVYETEAPPPDTFAPLAADLERGAIDAVLFTSKSTVEHLVDGLENLAQAGGTAGIAERVLTRVKIACIGPVTRDAAEARGLRVSLTASPYTVEALVLALEESFGFVDSQGPERKNRV